EFGVDAQQADGLSVQSLHPSLGGGGRFQDVVGAGGYGRVGPPVVDSVVRSLPASPFLGLPVVAGDRVQLWDTFLSSPADSGRVSNFRTATREKWASQTGRYACSVGRRPAAQAGQPVGPGQAYVPTVAS